MMCLINLVTETPTVKALPLTMQLMRKPKVLLFDGPTANLTPKRAVRILKKIGELKENLKTTHRPRRAKREESTQDKR